MLRFAPSPISDLSIDNLRVAIFNYIISKQKDEKLLIRIDDIDKEKNIEGKDKEILELLNLFSIEYENVVYQSENLKYYQKFAMQLMTNKKAFACFCSDEKLDELKQEAEKKGKTFEYDGFCEKLSDETVLNVNSPFTVRVTKAKENIKFTDFLKGNLEYKPSDIDSFIILGHNKFPTYNYACGVDDMIYDISTIIRTEDYIKETPKQIYLRELLGYPKEIEYIHIPNISYNSKDKIFSVKELVDEGFIPSAIANYLVLLGNKTPNEIFTLEEAIKWFDIKNISEASFDINRLKSINKKYLESMDNMRLSKILGFADTDIGKLAKLFLDEASTTKEIKKYLDLIFSAKSTCIGFEEQFVELKLAMKDAPFFNDFSDLEKYLIEKTKLEGEDLIKPLTSILTGRDNGPKITDIYPLIKNYLGEIVK